MEKTRGAKSSSPSSRFRAVRETPVQGSIPEPSQPLVVPPLVEDAPLSSLTRRYETRRPPTTPGVSSSRAKNSGSHPPKKKARVSTPLEPSKQPSKPPSEPQPSQLPATESQIPSRMTPKVVIKRPMPSAKAQRFLPSTVEIPYGASDDSQGFFHPHVALDFYQFMTTHQVRDPTVIHFTIDGRHDILGTRHIVEALRIPYEPARLEDYRVWTHPS
ncbi:hypothetical protein CK203_112626 [Vitis vinifera]|uniref:Uncharacterized protein n=1 Tax=Vitis vinifera TaxID=29760 RepID=A0A438CE35_VITVI|nr:hypothetical protein CK203_112626 [Vitis vinifera]